MSNSSQLENSFNDLKIDGKTIDEILKDCTIDLGGTGASMNDITIGSSDCTYTYNSDSTITLTTSGGAGQTYSIGSSYISDTITIDNNQFTFNFPEEWINSFPDWHRVKDMCDKYPGLKIAFDNFRVFYEMVKDDYDNPTPKK